MTVTLASSWPVQRIGTYITCFVFCRQRSTRLFGSLLLDIETSVAVHVNGRFVCGVVADVAA